MKTIRMGITICAVAFFLMELALRLPLPALKKLNGEVAKLPHKFLFTATLPYEPAPHAATCDHEFVNQDGLRGADLPLKKATGVIRLMTFGDSVVQGCSTPVDQTWQKELERLFAQEPIARNGFRLETLNLGVGGYHAREALTRLQQRGLKYEFDLAILHADWNDLFFSSLPQWKPGFSLVDVKFANPPPPLEGWRASLIEYSAVAKTLRSVRNFYWNKSNAIKTVQHRLVASDTPFNELALADYVKALNQTYDTLKTYGVKLALVRTPMYFHPDQVLTSDVLYHTRVLLQNFPLSPGESLEWQDRYTDAQREFARTHPEVIFIEAAKAFDEIRDPAERKALFTDHVHFTPKGAALLAREIYAAIQPELLRVAQR